MRRTNRPSLVYGLIGGTIAAACMTVVRTLARRRHVIDKTVPQAIEEWAVNRAGIVTFPNPVVHHVADQLLHLGYGAALGALYAATLGARGGRQTTSRLLGAGSVYGVATWLFGSWAMLPSLRAKKSPVHEGLVPNGVDLGAHLAFGLVTALMCDELSAQPDRGRTSNLRRLASRVG